MGLKVWSIKDSLEDKLFLAVLLFATPYFLIGMVNDYFSNTYDILAFDSVIAGVSILMLLVYRKEKYRPLLIIIYSGVWLLAFVFYWKLTGGVTGPATYGFVTLSIFLMLMLDANSRLMFAMLLVIVNFFLVFDPDMKPTDVTYASLKLEYVINSVFIVLVLIFFKLNFDVEGNQLDEVRESLARSNEQLHKQEQELLKKHNEIKLLKENLQSKVQERTRDIDRKNKLLAEYAFTNAHLVREPISRILGLIKAAELQNTKSRSELKGIKKNVVELEKVIGRISRVLD